MHLQAAGRRLVLGAAACCLFLLTAAAPASASHLKGGTISASISPTGTLQTDVTWFQREPGCTVDPNNDSGSTLVVTAPDGTSANVDLPLPIVRCIGNTAFYRGSVTYELNDASGPFGSTAPSGRYRLTVDTCCRVAGILNSSDSSFNLTGSLRNVPGSTTSTPRFLGSTATGASRGYAYSGDVSAADPEEAGPVGYALLQASDPAAPNYDTTGPATNVVDLVGTRANVSSSTTAGWDVGDYFVYKIQAADVDGDTAQLDILVEVTDNRPPALDAPAEITVVAGQSVQAALSATDPDNAAPKTDSVAIATGDLPTWITPATVDGNPATGTLTIAPPAGTTGIYYIAVDATDDDPLVVLLDSRVIAVRVVPPAPLFTARPPASSDDGTPTFTFTGAAGSRFECSLDDGAFTPCSSPYSPSGLSPGEHSLSVRAVDDTGAVSGVETYAWTITAVAAAAPGAPATSAPPTASPVVSPGCVSRRSFRVNWRVPAGQRIRTASLAISGKAARRLSVRARRATIDLRGIPAATVKVTVRVRTASGKVLTSSRTYRTCWPGQKAGPPLTNLVLRPRG